MRKKTFISVSYYTRQMHLKIELTSETKIDGANLPRITFLQGFIYLFCYFLFLNFKVIQ